jgi:hypothetical protein
MSYVLIEEARQYQRQLEFLSVTEQRTLQVHS